MKQSHRSTACRLVYRGYTEDMKTIFFFLLVQTTFHSYQSPPGQQVQEKKKNNKPHKKPKKKTRQPTSTGPSSRATTQRAGLLKAQHMEKEKIEEWSSFVLPRQNLYSLHFKAPALYSVTFCTANHGTSPPPAGDYSVLVSIAILHDLGASSSF